MTKVALIVDVRGWALEHIGNDLRALFAPEGFEIDVIAWHEDLIGRSNREIRRVLAAEYDVLWPFSLFEATRINALGLPYIATVHMAPATAKLSTPRSEIFDQYAPCFQRAGLNARALSVISPLLEEVWGAQREIFPVRVGVSADEFYPPKEKPRSDVLRVGWVGNPDKPYKRYNIITEALAGLEGIELRPLFWHGLGTEIPRTRTEVAYYYREEIDVYVCTSDHEGLPTPAIECAPCGVPIISVDVGVIREIVEDGITGYVIPQRPDVLRQTLVTLRDNRGILESMSKEIAIRAADKFLWECTAAAWLAFLREGTKRISEGDCG